MNWNRSEERSEYVNHRQNRKWKTNWTNLSNDVWNSGFESTEKTLKVLFHHDFVTFAFRNIPAFSFNFFYNIQLKPTIIHSFIYRFVSISRYCFSPDFIMCFYSLDFISLFNSTQELWPSHASQSPHVSRLFTVALPLLLCPVAALHSWVATIASSNLNSSRQLQANWTKQDKEGKKIRDEETVRRSRGKANQGDKSRTSEL